MSKKVIFGLLMICVIAGLVAVGTWAYFSDIETSEDNTFTAGSLDLKVDGFDDPNVMTYFDVECVKPGDFGSAEITLENVGCCVPAIADIHILNLVDEENGLTEPELKLGDTEPVGELSENMWITMTAYDEAGVEMWYEEGWLDILHCQNFIMGALDPGTMITLIITWEVPAGTGNIIQTDSVSFDIEFSLDQRVGLPADMSLRNLVQPTQGIVCEPITISVDVTNNGDITGSVKVSLDLDGVHKEKSVTVKGGDTGKATFMWHPEEPGTYTAVVSIPNDGGVGPHSIDCPEPIEVLTPPEASADWTEPLPMEVYVCDTLVVLVTAHNIGDISGTWDISIVITVDGVEKYSETQTVTLDPCVPVNLTFGPWHVCDPVEMDGTVELQVGGVTVKTHTMTIIDMDPVVTEISPPTCTSLTPPGSVTISARVTDDAGVLGVGYTIDDPGGVPAPMALVSGTPLDGTYESVAPWNYSAVSLGDHAVIVGAMDTKGNIAGDYTVVHVEKAILHPVSLTADPSPAIECDEVTISITVHNSGNITGTFTIVVTINGITVINQTVTLDPCDSVTLTGTWHAEVGTWTISGAGLTTTLVVNPAAITYSSTWVMQWTYNGIPDALATTHLVQLVDPIVDLVPLCTQVVPPAGAGVQADVSLSMHPTRGKAGTPITLYSITAYADPTNGNTKYAWIPGDTAGTPLEIEQAYEAYTLLSGSHMGKPYEVGTSWSFNAHSIGLVAGMLCMTESTTATTVTVVSANQTVTVPAGTFTDCFRIEVDTAAAGIQIQWWSPTAQGIVKQTDDQSWDFPEVWELISYSLVY